MENIKKTTQTFKAIVINDKSDGYTIFLDGLSGPVINSPDLEDAKTKFSEALNLACAVRNLNVFSAAIKERDFKELKKLAKKTSRNYKPIVEYRQIEAILC